MDRAAAEKELLELQEKYAKGFLPRDQYGVDMVCDPKDIAWLERIEADIKRMCELMRLAATARA